MERWRRIFQPQFGLLSMSEDDLAPWKLLRRVSVMPDILRELSNVPFQLNPTADDHCRVQASIVRKGRRVEAERSELCWETRSWSWMSLSQAHHSAF